VLRDRNFVALLGLNVLFVAVGYEVFALLPPFASNSTGSLRAHGSETASGRRALLRFVTESALENRLDGEAIGKGPIRENSHSSHVILLKEWCTSDRITRTRDDSKDAHSNSIWSGRVPRRFGSFERDSTHMQY
jgi:hypothetical protein